MTINEFVFGIISYTMREHIVSEGDKETTHIRVACPFSLRQTPRHELDFNFKNDFAILPIDMRLIDNLDTGMRQIRDDIAYVKTSPMPFGYYYASYFILSLPLYLSNWILEDFAGKFTMGFSNVPGSKEQWTVAGYKGTALGFSMPLGRTVPLGWGAISFGNNLKIMVCADKAAIKDTDKLMASFETNLDKFMNSTDWRNWNPIEPLKP